MQQKTILGSIIVLVLIAYGFVVWKLHALAPTPETYPDTSILLPPISAAKVPDGWYSHETNGMEHAITVLSRTKDATTTEQISISSVDALLSPDDFMLKQGLVGGSPNSPNAQWSWGIYQGYKTFSMTITANDTAQWFV